MKWTLVFILFPIFSFSQIIEEDSAGEFAPNFYFQNLAGESIALESLEGKVVYISFWASWCKPCIQGFEKYAETRKAIAEAGVVLLNISIDTKEEAWKNAIDKYKIEGIHGLTPKADLMDSYQLYNVPRYEIVGKEGNFLYLDRSEGISVLENFELFVKQ